MLKIAIHSHIGHDGIKVLSELEREEEDRIIGWYNGSILIEKDDKCAYCIGTNPYRSYKLPGIQICRGCAKIDHIINPQLEIPELKYGHKKGTKIEILLQNTMFHKKTQFQKSIIFRFENKNKDLNNGRLLLDGKSDTNKNNLEHQLHFHNIDKGSFKVIVADSLSKSKEKSIVPEILAVYECQNKLILFQDRYTSLPKNKIEEISLQHKIEFIFNTLNELSTHGFIHGNPEHFFKYVFIKDIPSLTVDLSYGGVISFGDHIYFTKQHHTELEHYISDVSSYYSVFHKTNFNPTDISSLQLRVNELIGKKKTTYYKIKYSEIDKLIQLRLYGIRLLGDCLDFYIAFVSLITSPLVLKQIKSNLKLLKIWNLMWNSSEVLNIEFKISKGISIKRIISDVHLRSDILDIIKEFVSKD